MILYPLNTTFLPLQIQPLAPPVMATLSPAEIKQLEAHKTDTQQPNMIATLIICAILAYTAVALRLLARHKQKVNLGADDWWIVGALVFITLSRSLK